jgi:hypothetical protein
MFPSAASDARPEAELESRLATGLAVAFPNIPRDQLLEQRRFTVRLGQLDGERRRLLEFL